MRYLFIALVLIGTAVWVAAPALLGFSLADMPVALRTGAAMGAKLGCSSLMVSGFDADRARQDLMSYSPANALLALRREGNQVHASLPGYDYSATYRPGTGCTLDPGDSTILDAIRLAAIRPDDALPVARDTALQALAGALLEQDNGAGLDTRVLLVVRGGAIRAEAYGAGISADTPLLGWSMGKSVTAMLAGRLEALGQPLPDSGPLFPEWAGDDRREIRLVHLLTMTSGLDWDETYVPGSDSTRMLFLEPAAATRPLASLAAKPPGTHFYYSSGTTNLLMALLHRRLGGSQALYDLFQRELAQPLGLAGITFEPDPSGVPVGSSYLYAPGRDWARLGQLLLNRGTWQGQALLSPDWIDRATTPNGSDNDRRYGYQFWLNRGGEEARWAGLPEDAFAMMGNRGQTVMVIPSADAVIVRLGWNAGPYPIEDRFSRLLAAAGEVAG